jgi:nucleoside-diphosphate-sugar epimerase
VRVLVTGATGFVGQAVVTLLLASGHRVRVLVVPGTESVMARRPGIELVVGSVTDRRPLETAARGADSVLHLAGLLPGHPAHALAQVNIAGTANVVNACAGNNVRRLVFLSSTSVYRDASIPLATGIHETAPLRNSAWSDVEIYGLSKVQAESRVMRLRNGLAYVIVRAPLVYGTTHGWDRRLFEGLRQRPRITASGKAMLRTMQWVHIDDLARGLVLVLAHPAAANQVFNIAGAERFSLRDVARAVWGVMHDSGGPLWRSDCLKYDIRKARSTLGYEPAIRLTRIAARDGA